MNLILIKNNYNNEFNELNKLYCEIFRITFYDKLRWALKKKKFEWFVGCHWSYPYRNKICDFILRKPKWLFKILLG